ncbi:hypothetical protein FXV77_12645 [Sphingobacterium phlebotomi]|uniref:DUF4468 domain-containing protein n=1 Tax=Sphingobacterium phlebotomi TaxID=2605433 RepID=A0A5D4H4X1_9SPHI|nr:hypothetical protein [Sphingobacterium phlebotomi]TYR35564.1 hypothetical protein FXV77_12645 [Sphingobacterium phlebotomi]
MTIKKYIITLSLILVSIFAFTQTKLPFLTVKDIDKRTAFEELVELLADSDYFIQNIEKQAGFIQVKAVIKKRGIFAKRAGNKIMYNIFVKQASERVAQINFQANIEISDRTEDGYYYRDEGISNDPKDYEELLKLIESHFENQ